ncbi:MAG: porin family protein [Flavobacteriaceae bacterium]|nr:porin family protein [Flavobacteriaceae bacterium]
MKNLLLIITVFLAVQSFGQISYGAKVGVNMSKIKDVHGDSNQGFGFMAGGFVSIPLQDYSQEFFIQPELLFSQLGEKDGSESVKLNYIQIPVLFKAYFSEQDTEFFGEIGPQLGFMLGQNLPKNYRYNHEFNTFDYGVTAGVGFSYLRTWEINMRFYYGFADVLDKDVRDARNFNSYFSGGLAYRF